MSVTANEIRDITGTNRRKVESLARKSLGQKLIDDRDVVVWGCRRQSAFLQQIMTETFDDALPSSLDRPALAELNGPILAEQG
jgi:hypothetical protein